MYVYGPQATGGQKRDSGIWNWSKRELWVMGTEPRSSAKTSAINH